MARVILVNPPWYRLQGGDFPEIPLGICYIASYLKAKGHTVKVFNADFSQKVFFTYKDMYDGFTNYKTVLNDLNNDIWKSAVREIMSFRPDIVGISLKTGSYKSGCNIARLVKEMNPGITIVGGGVHPTLVPAEVAGSGFFDYVIRGEGEESFLELINALNNNTPPDKVKGIAYHDGSKVVITDERPFIPDLDILPFPERDDLSERELYLPDSVAILMTARGCPHACTFCASERIWKRKVRFRSSENVLGEMRLLKNKYGIKHLKIRDDLFTMKKTRVIEICDSMIKENFGFSWQCEVRADSLDEDIVRKIREAGCIGASIGIESGNDLILSEIKKGETTEQMRKAIKLLKKYGINVGAFIMIGFPGETEAQMLETMNFVRRTEPDHVILSIVTPYPGTELHDKAMEKGLIDQSAGWEEYFHQSPRMGLAGDSAEFNRVSGKLMREVELYNKSIPRKLKKRLYQACRNPKAVCKSALSLLSRIKNG